MGIETELDGLPAETLGGLRLGVSPLEMANAYATLASGGIRNKPIAIKKVSFPDGHVDELGEPDRERVFSDGVAYEVTQILEDNVDAGTGTSAGTGCGDEAGKTGTTDDFNDAMFIGYTPKLSTGVWVGYPDALISMSSVHGVSVAGGTFPAKIWHDFMSVALDRTAARPSPSPRTRSSGSPSTASTPRPPAPAAARPRSAAPAAPRAPTAATPTDSTLRGDRRGRGRSDEAPTRPGVGQKPAPKPEAQAEAEARPPPPAAASSALAAASPPSD